MKFDRGYMEDLYSKAKLANVGDTIICPTCQGRFIKKSYQQAFCGMRGHKNSKGKRTLCKDQYWNTINTDRHLGGLRGYQLGVVSMTKLIQYEDRLEELQDDDDFEDLHPFSGDAIGQD